jgi:hypothetical protein
MLFLSPLKDWFPAVEETPRDHTHPMLVENARTVTDLTSFCTSVVVAGNNFVKNTVSVQSRCVSVVVHHILHNPEPSIMKALHIDRLLTAVHLSSELISGHMQLTHDSLRLYSWGVLGAPCDLSTSRRSGIVWFLTSSSFLINSYNV